MMQVITQAAYVLHSRAYRETSALIDLLTLDYGRMSVVAKGIRKPRGTRQALLQPFSPLWVSWTGRSELKVLTAVESRGISHPLQGKCLFAGLYLNELLIALLHKWDAHPLLFEKYEQTLQMLHASALNERVLRIFEQDLLQELGYAPLPKWSDSLHNTFLPDQYYCFIHEQGFVLTTKKEYPLNHPTVFLGEHLLGIAKGDWQDESILKAAKRLTRLILAPLLGAKEIYSRQLFR